VILKKKLTLRQENRRTVAALNAGIVMIVCACLLAAAPVADQNADDDGIDRSIKPGDDFYRYANGNWLRTAVIPADQESYDNRLIMKKESAERVRGLLQAAAASHPAKGTVTQKVGDYYASVMDETGIEAKGLAPLADEMAAIVAISDNKSLSSYIGSTLNSEVEGLIANADHVFGVWINQGFEDSDHNLPHLWQGGLGLPDRDIYLDSSPKMADLRAKYETHIAAILKIAGFEDADSRAATVLSLESKIAHAFAPDSDAADVSKQNNSWKRADFAIKAPGMDWHAFFDSAGLGGQSDFIVWQPSAVTGVSALVQSEALDEWKDYLRFHLIEHYAVVLPKSAVAEGPAFAATASPGEPQMPNHDETAITATNGALGQAVGQLYAQRYFPPEAKAKAQAMARDLLTAWSARISNLTWMSPQTKEKALAKLAAFEIGIGYPDQWIDYSTLDVVRGDALGNMRRAEAFIRQRNLAQLKQPVGPIEWPINPQTPGAIIMFSPNAEFFSAAILQPPYFDANGDSASNYGSAGAGMAHEIGHSFDELGNIYDAHGRLHSWWTAVDRARYKSAAAKLATQLDAYCPLPDLCVKGQQVLGESINDLAGVLIAHDAYMLSLKGKPDVVIGGLTGEQRFFLSFARRWRKIQTEASLLAQIATDTHAPAECRADAVRNVDAWYEAFPVGPNDKLFVKPEQRVRIW
jgi:putative endopeptidase